jgi:hypothetical protein
VDPSLESFIDHSLMFLSVIFFFSTVFLLRAYLLSILLCLKAILNLKPSAFFLFLVRLPQILTLHAVTSIYSASRAHQNSFYSLLELIAVLIWVFLGAFLLSNVITAVMGTQAILSTLSVDPSTGISCQQLT